MSTVSGSGIMSSMGAAQKLARPHASTLWVDDVRWHRQMYGQSRFRWAPEDPLTIASRLTAGRLTFSTPRHLHQLEQALAVLSSHQARIAAALAPPLREVRHEFGASWTEVLKEVALSPLEARIILWSCPGSGASQDVPDADAQRAIRGLPLPNPLTEIWELRQVALMYEAAWDLLEDALCDLVHELAPTRDLAQIARHTTSGDRLQLEFRLARQRERRGEPGDVRRLTVQHY